MLSKDVIFLIKKAKEVKEFAPGIPLPKTKHIIPTKDSPVVWTGAIQEHITPRGKGERTHIDLRLSPPGSSRAYSWAIPKAELPKPGEKYLAVEQPTHTADYMSFSGNITEGYGKGKVKLRFNDKIEVIRSSPDKVLFNVYSSKLPEEYAMIRIDGNNWVILNRTITQQSKKITVPLKEKIKPKFKDISPEEAVKKNLILMPKLDGAFSTIILGPKENRAFSYRTPKEKGRVLEYTHKIPALLGKGKEIKPSILKAEILARKGKTVAEAKDVAGLLNSKVWKSREGQKIYGKLEPWSFDIDTYEGKKVSDMPFEERRVLLEKIVAKYDFLNLMPAITGAKKQEALLKKIKEKKYPLTYEGAILVDPKDNKFYKAKFRPDHDVYIRDFYRGKGKYDKKAVGGFEYSLTPRGRIIGKVGTGFNDKLRINMKEHPEKYIGKVSRLKSLGVFYDKKGNIKSLRAPSFIDIHPEKNIGM